MAFRKHDVRDLYESIDVADPRQKAVGFARTMTHMMGLTDKNGRRHRDAKGLPCLRDVFEDGQSKQRLSPHAFSLEQLGRGLLGDDLFEDLYSPDSKQLASIRGQIGHDLLEDGAGAVGPGAYANVNAFAAVVSGLLEVSVLEGYKNPQFIADQLAPVDSTKMFDGRKVIGSTRIGDLAEERLPGMPTKRVQIGERWITQPRTIENALSVEVLQETVFLDLTGQVLEQANNLGEWLGYRKEVRVIDAFIGVTNTYSYKGTGYNTYLTASTWDNDVSSNELLHESNMETVMIKFRNMQDPETGTRILTSPSKCLFNMGKMRTARRILGDLAIGTRYADATTSTWSQNEAAPAYKGMFDLLTSPIVYDRCVASDGLNLSATNAEKYWWTWEPGCLKYAQNYPIQVQQAVPNTVEMLDRGVVLYAKAWERGIPMWYEPRKVVRSKN